MSFKQAMNNVMKGGKYDKKAAAAIVANASAKASPAAKRKNPKLAKVLEAQKGKFAKGKKPMPKPKRK